MLRRSTLLLSASVLAGASQAQAAPSVVTDIAPVHALVAEVMGDLGEPFLLVTPGVSPHDHAMRPSQARALQNADVVFNVGAGLTPWLDKALGNLSGDAVIIELAETPGVEALETRDLAVFASDDHHDEHDDDHGDHDDHDGHDDHHDGEDDHDDHAHDEHEHDDHKDAHEDHAEHDDHAHDDHDDHAHDEHDDHDDHDDHADEHGHAHDHGGVDPHMWLDPVNATVWVGAIADALSAADPENAATYAANAGAMKASLAELQAGISAKLDSVKGRPFIVYHDAYHYFETRFDIPAAGAIAYSDAVDPSAARIDEIRSEVAKQGIVCVFAEPQYDSGLVTAVFGESTADARVLDPLGAELELGAGFYPQLLTELADTLHECLTPQ